MTQVFGLAGESLVSDGEFELLVRSVEEHDDVLELGTWMGVTAARLAAERPKARIISVDCFGGGRRTLEAWFDNHRQNQRLYVAMTGQALELDIVFDVVIVDAAHDYESVKRDLQVAQTMIGHGGRILCHDYNEPVPPDREVMRATTEFCAATGWKVVEVVDMLAVLKRG